MTVLSGLRIIITAGATEEPIDPVRYITNPGTGKQGFAMADVFVEAGAEVVMVLGTTPLSMPENPPYDIVRVRTAQGMLEASLNALPADIAVCTASVTDWRPLTASSSKLKKTEIQETFHLELVKNPDTLQALGSHPTSRPRLVIGFSAESQAVLAHAHAKRLKKGCDWILSNDITKPGEGFGSETNTIHFITDITEESWPSMTKRDIAVCIRDKIVRWRETEAAA